jgi:hypothetical protein
MEAVLEAYDNKQHNLHVASINLQLTPTRVLRSRDGLRSLTLRVQTIENRQSQWTRIHNMLELSKKGISSLRPVGTRILIVAIGGGRRHLYTQRSLRDSCLRVLTRTAKAAWWYRRQPQSHHNHTSKLKSVSGKLMKVDERMSKKIIKEKEEKNDDNSEI